MQPLLIFVKEKGPNQHVILGCWKENSTRFRPVVTEVDKIKKEQILILEATGVTDRWTDKLSYDDAVEYAYDYLSEENLLFTLDIAALRQTVLPLQFPMSPGVTKILRQAEALARKQMSAKLETRHLLFSLLIDDDKKIKEVFEQAGGDISRERIEKAISSMPIMSIEGKDGVAPRPTINYRRVLEDARLIASDTGLKSTEKSHLFYAILLSQSESVDFVLKNTGFDHRRVKGSFEDAFEWVRKIEQTMHFEDVPASPVSGL